MKINTTPFSMNKMTRKVLFTKIKFIEKISFTSLDLFKNKTNTDWFSTFVRFVSKEESGLLLFPSLAAGLLAPPTTTVNLWMIST